MKILILDDLDVRHVAFAKIYAEHEVTSVYVYDDFLVKINECKWDLIHLDHDLGDFVSCASTYVDGWGNICDYNGQHAAMRVCELDDAMKPDNVIVHSVNPYGARVMVQMIKNAGIPVVWEPFGEIN